MKSLEDKHFGDNFSSSAYRIFKKTHLEQMIWVTNQIENTAFICITRVGYPYGGKSNINWWMDKINEWRMKDGVSD